MNQINKNKYSSLTKISLLQKAFRCPLSGLFVYWLFQGMLYMDRTERFFKFGFDLVFTILFLIVLRFFFSWQVSIFISLFFAHTFNFLFNGQIWVLLKHYGFVTNTFKKYEHYYNELSGRIVAESSLRFAAVYGSLVRGEWQSSSDLDVRLVRRHGLSNGLRACVFVLKERSRSLFQSFPLDIYILDDSMSLNKMSPNEKPIIILDNMEDS